MLNTTLDRLRCPRRKKGKTLCGSSLQLFPLKKTQGSASGGVFEVSSGHLECLKCRTKFPILAGVALLVDDVRFYLLSHVKGIAQVVADSEIPPEYRREFLEAKQEIQQEHIEEDLEAERVNALYLMNHYLRVRHVSKGDVPWWRPLVGEGSPLIDSLIREHWDQGPFSMIDRWVSQLSKKSAPMEAIELGCGVGGLFPVLKKNLKSYLGVDSSFASVALGRHLSLGVPYPRKIRIPGDLLRGSVSREVSFPRVPPFEGNADYIVGDLGSPPLQAGYWDLSIALNAIDMLDVPATLPALQKDLIKENGVAIQSCPYIWHEAVAKRLRSALPRDVQDSARAVEWLYEKAGFKIEEKLEHLPWLFFKHLRQLEIYSVHLFLGRREK